MAKILFLDLETTNLKADWGTLLCGGYKWADQKTVHVPSIMDFPGWERDVTNDRALVKHLAGVVQSADMLVTHYGKRFDIPYLNAKLLEYNLPPLPQIAHVDTYFIARSHLAVSRRKLDTLARWLKCSVQKSPVEGTVWKKAMAGHPSAMRYVIRHCKADVLVLEEVYGRLRNLLISHPRVAGYGPCRVCGSQALQRRGYALSSLKGVLHRVYCLNCHAWENRPGKGLPVPR